MLSFGGPFRIELAKKATLIDLLVINTLLTLATPQHSHPRPRWSLDQASKDYSPLPILATRPLPFRSLLTLVAKLEKFPLGEASN